MTETYCPHDNWHKMLSGSGECDDCKRFLYRDVVADLERRDQSLADRVGALSPEALAGAQQAVLEAAEPDLGTQPGDGIDPNRRCQCGHKRKHHTDRDGSGQPSCIKCFDAGTENMFHEFIETGIPPVMPDEPEAWICDDCGAYVVGDGCTAPRCQEIARLRLQILALENGPPTAVVFSGGGRPPVEMFVPPGFAVTLTAGGILVLRQDYPVDTIVSVRTLPQGEADAVQDHTEQGQDQAGVDRA